MTAVAPLEFSRRGRRGPHRLHEEWEDPEFETGHQTHRPSTPPDPEWGDKLNAAVRDISRQLSLAFRLNQLEAAVERLESRESSLRVRIQSLSPWPARLLRDLEITLRPTGEGWEANFFDANLHASGDTETEAIDNFKVSLIDELEILGSIPESALGPEMIRQFRVLSELVELSDEHHEG